MLSKRGAAHGPDRRHSCSGEALPQRRLGIVLPRDSEKVGCLRCAGECDEIDLIASDATGRFRLRTPKLPTAVHGAGDAVAALFFLHLLRTGAAGEALSLAASAIFGVLERTADAGADEMLIIAAQEELVRPRKWFRAEPV